MPKILTQFDFSKIEALNFVIQKLSSAPSSPVEGQIYYNTTDDKLYYRTASAWVEVGSGSGSGDVTGPESATDSQIVLFDSTTGKVIKALSLTGLIKVASGVPSAATPGTDYSTPDSTETLTNKTLDANGSGNTITNIETADLASGVLNTNTSLSGATNSQIPSAAAVKAYADALIEANDAMTFQGGIDASTNPNYPAAEAGHTYKITVTGKIGGASGPAVQVGDTLICTTDSTSSGDHATVGSSWTIIQANVDRATTSTLGLAEYATEAEAEAKSSEEVAVTPAALTNFPIKKTFTVGNGSDTAITLTHNLGTKEVIVQVRLASDDSIVICDVQNTTTNTVTLGFATAPASNAIKAVVIG